MGFSWSQSRPTYESGCGNWMSFALSRSCQKAGTSLRCRPLGSYSTDAARYERVHRDHEWQAHPGKGAVRTGVDFGYDAVCLDRFEFRTLVRRSVERTPGVQHKQAAAF